MTMNLWAIAMAKDEGDIVYDTLCHLAANEVDGIIIADNLSKDNTREQIEKAARYIKNIKPNLNLIILEDNVIAYEQSDKMTALAHKARENGANWIIPFDVDEIWFSPNSTLKKALIDIDNQGYDIYRSLYTNHSITVYDEQNISPFKSMIYKWNLPTNHKSCFKFRQNDSRVKISNGNHFVQHNGWDIGRNVKVAIDDYGSDRVVFGPKTVQIRHFQWRSLDQFIRKILKSYESCKALESNSDLYNGAAWAEHFKIYEKDGIEGLKQYYYANILVGEDLGQLIKDPAPLMELV